MDSTAAPPVDEVRIGRIKATIWANTGTDGRTRYNVTLSRLYKTNEGWRRTQNFGRDDLLLLAKVIDQAHSSIFALTADAADEAAAAAAADDEPADGGPA